MVDLKGPQLLHIRTVKGKGFAPAEADPVGFHAINKIETTSTAASNSLTEKPAHQSTKMYSAAGSAMWPLKTPS